MDRRKTDIIDNIIIPQVYPAGHKLQGQPNYFVKQILNHLGIDVNKEYLQWLCKVNITKDIRDIMGFYDTLLNNTSTTKEYVLRDQYKPKLTPKVNLRTWIGRMNKSTILTFAKDVKVSKEIGFIYNPEQSDKFGMNKNNFKFFRDFVGDYVKLM